jgi:hypothetical protein
VNPAVQAFRFGVETGVFVEVRKVSVIHMLIPFVEDTADEMSREKPAPANSI